MSGIRRRFEMAGARVVKGRQQNGPTGPNGNTFCGGKPRL